MEALEKCRLDIMHCLDTAKRDLNSELELASNTSSATVPKFEVEIEVDNSESVTGSKHKSLQMKYNKIYEQSKEIYAQLQQTNTARKELELRLRSERKKVNDYYTYTQNQQEVIIKNKSKIKSLQEEIRNLKGEAMKRPPQTVGHPSIGGTLAEDSVPQLPRRNHGGVVHKLSRDVSNTEINVDPREASFSLTRAGLCVPSTASECHRSATESPTCKEESDIPLAITKNLGYMPSELLKSGNASVEDTQFVDLEPHHSSSTQSDTDFVPAISPSDREILSSSPLPHLPSSPDIPVFISSRAVKKRKLGTDQESERRPATKIKVEHVLSSSPIGLNAILPSDSIDLDDIGRKQATPRKQRREPIYQTSANLLAATNPDISTSRLNLIRHQQRENNTLPITPKTTIIRKNDTILRQLSTNKQILPRAANKKAPSRRRTPTNKDVSQLLEDGENTQLTDILLLGKYDGRLGNLLETPTSPKHIITPASRAVQSQDIATKSENQEYRSLNSDTRTTSVKDHDDHSPSETGRMTHEVFNKKHSKVGARPSLPSLNTDATRGVARLLSRDKELSLFAGSPIMAKSQSLVLADRKNEHPLKVPLRTRPVEQLSLSNFKINPKFNQGKNYAFNEVVRNKQARQCLPGCTKPDCCGDKFKNMARLMQEPDEVLTLSQEEANYELLKVHLGDNAYKLDKMSDKLKADLLIDAKARDYANKFSRHRVAYERPKSPVGFWRVDFPTTQEEIDDRAKIKEQTFAKIKERYDEAMRPGGRYLFYDE
ncbi:DNA repair protein endonuclease SAE2/CtIP C-terminus-domain-containing protein [Calycina marina]|uniref:DNA repair protein endonuclease SAE2/CtIP C-terminus-domain-containing protein n=1 Tax=Calycina marina TaxID=1763456 RepID=A0A9P8CH12_9HELO|nr:DNA repair protein endonuclease SAE2/CtIP C-terminus-domain-containing protein [Calycina marina]